MKKFDIPEHYKSPIISKVKARRKLNDPLKKDFSPTVLNFGNVEFVIARHFGFCYGVENAIEKSYKAINDNKMNGLNNWIKMGILNSIPVISNNETTTNTSKTILDFPI